MPDADKNDTGHPLSTSEATLAPRWLRMHTLALVLVFVAYGSLAWWSPGGIPASVALAVLLSTVVLWFITQTLGRTWLAIHGYPLMTLFVFVAHAALAVFDPDNDWTSLARTLLLAVIGLWFIYCVIGDADSKLDNLFTFTYTFTIGAFALLLFPLLSDQVPQRKGAGGQAHAEAEVSPLRNEGALRLVRGCVRQDGSGSRTLGDKLAPCPPVLTAASAPVPEGIAVTGVRYAWLINVGGATARTLAINECGLALALSATRAAEAASAASAVESAAAAAAAAPKAAAASATDAAVQAKKQSDQRRSEAAQAKKSSDAACTAQGNDDPKRPFVEVTGGVAVPLFVVVLALIGGAVSISRRIPEFQRRNNPNYVATAEEPFMPAYKVRESVVFQIMQLISAPFLAIATLQVIEPNNLASASTLAFATGFFSETILYMIRGMVNGLQPGLTKMVSPAMVNLYGLLSWQDKPSPGDFAKVRIVLKPPPPGEWRSVQVDKGGNFAINSVTAGHYTLAVSGEGIIEPPEQPIDVDDKPHKLIEITVTTTKK